MLNTNLSIRLTAVVVACLGVFVSLSGCAPSFTDPDHRTPGTVKDDVLIQQLAKKNLRLDLDHLPDERIRVSVFNGVVLLTGQISTPARKERATKVIEDIEYVRAIQNELTTEDFRGVIGRQRDAFLSFKVNRSLNRSKRIDAKKFSVVIDRATAYVMGLATQFETEAMTDIVRDVRGIKKVVTIVEYTD